MAINYTDLESIINGFQKILSIQTVGSPTKVPSPLILVGSPLRAGLSPTKIASRIIARKSEAGLPVGALPSGGVAPAGYVDNGCDPTGNNSNSSRYFTVRTCNSIRLNYHINNRLWSRSINTVVIQNINYYMI